MCKASVIKVMNKIEDKLVEVKEQVVEKVYKKGDDEKPNVGPEVEVDPLPKDEEWDPVTHEGKPPE